MKVSTIKTLMTLTTNEEVLTELATELAKAEKAELANAAREAEKAEFYSAAHDTVMAALREATSPVTAGELWATIENDVPEQFSKGNLTYALTHQWAGEVVKTPGRVNLYAIKA